MRRILFVCAAALVAGWYSVSLCSAQTSDHVTAVAPEPPDIDSLDVPAAPAAVSLNLIDQKLALSLAVDTHAQIEMADAALKAIADDALRRYVTARLESQRAFAARLDTLSRGRTREALSRALREIEQAKTEKSHDAKFRLLSVRNATAMLARIRLEMAQEYTRLLHAELASKSGDEFDRHYLRSELVNQMQMLSMLKVFEGQASADFARVIHEAQATAIDDLDRARQLLLQMEAATLAGPATAKLPLTEAIAPPPQEPAAQHP